MARGLAILSITTFPDNRIDVTFATGSPVAPNQETGSMVFQNQASLHQSIKDLETSLTTEQLLLLHLAITWLQPNGTLGNTNQVLNKELRFDTTAAQPVRIV